MQVGRCKEYIDQFDTSFPRLEESATFGSCQRVGDFDRKDVRGNQLVELIAVVVAKPKSPRRICFGQDPLHGHRSVKDKLHWSRASRIKSTAISTVPILARNSSRIRSIRSHALRTSSGSRWLIGSMACWIATRSSVNSGDEVVVLILELFNEF
jgi:hypothetical protein